jgi:hypothetical protein
MRETRKSMRHGEPINLGPLDIRAIEALFGHELEPGDVLLTTAALAHARASHPDDVDRCLPFVGRIVASPTYIGDDLRNRGKIELIGRMPGGDGLLVAVTIELSRSGHYHVASFYPVSQAKIDRRRRSCFLKNVVAK